ncbi:hypothetical protein BDW02DRAFT_336128 [Decorospora gaudefroyi]|uniref:Uncharacterized protein n=1 Tax=Decorospora gaudefroyi TaxID=184978 RepID=A0A6A5KY89_9PLEO|nr:hypothetical protein BDW02DRAFT_336128 [Decorospora gaudefroyi]
MATSVSSLFTPHQSSPLARTTSPFKDPRPPPCTPARTAKLWDHYERRAIEKARRRDKAGQTPQHQRSSASDIGKERKSSDGATVRSSFDFKFRRAHAATPSTTVATCKTCQQPITYNAGVCERCTRTIILTSPTGETTPPLSPSARNFGSTDLQQLHKNSSREDVTVPQSKSPKRKSFCPIPSQIMDPPIRLSSLRPPPPQEPIQEPTRSRKTSLTDPNEPFLRLQITHQPHASPSRPTSHPTTPDYTPTTPPSATHSRSSTRPSSLANIALLPASAYAYSRSNNSGTPSYASPSTVTTSPPSLCRVSYALQNTTSAWDDWDSDDDDADKVGLVGWVGRKVRSRGSGGGGAKEEEA